MDQLRDFVERSLRTDVVDTLCPRGAARDPEDRPDDRNRQIDDREALIVAILSVQNHVDHGERQRDKHGRHAGENEELRRWFHIVAGRKGLRAAVCDRNGRFSKVVGIGPFGVGNCAAFLLNGH